MAREAMARRAHRPSTSASPSSPIAACAARDRSFFWRRTAPGRSGEIPGTVEDLRWTSDGAALIALAADRGLDAGATEGAMRLSWGDIEDPAVTDPAPGAAPALSDRCRRRRHRRDRPRRSDGLGVRSSGRSDAALALVSADPSERGWYRARLARLDLARRTAEILHEFVLAIAGPGRRSRWAARRLPRRLVQRPRPRRRGHPDSGSRRRARHEPGRRQALQCHRHSVARCGEPLVRRLASPGLGLWRHRPRRRDPMDDARGRGHRPQQLPRPDHARAGRARASPPSARPSDKRPRSC